MVADVLHDCTGDLWSDAVLESVFEMRCHQRRNHTGLRRLRQLAPAKSRSSIHNVVNPFVLLRLPIDSMTIEVIYYCSHVFNGRCYQAASTTLQTTCGTDKEYTT